MKLSFYPLLVFLFLFAPHGLRAELTRTGHASVELVPEYAALTPGTTTYVALRIVHDSGWHTYWLSSTTGYAPSLRWELPEGVTAGEILHPLPEVYSEGGIVDYIHRGEVLLPVPITLDNSYRPGADGRLVLKAHLELLVCADQCVPESADLQLSLPVGRTGPGPETQWAQTIRATADLTAAGDSSHWAITVTQEGRAAVIDITGDGTRDPGRLYFFSSDGLIAATALQDQKALPGGTVRLTLPFSQFAPDKPEALNGYLTASRGWGPGEPRAFALAARLNVIPSTQVTRGKSIPSGNVAATTFLPAIGFALLGGLILNLMPCVFPILGLKVMSFLKLAKKRGGAAWRNASAFVFGVMTTFTALAVLLISLRAAGTRLGWGFQLQDPRVLFIGVILFLLFGLNMAGVFEIGLSAPGFGANRERQIKGEFAGAFFSGVLAVVVATPCSAPFLGTAVGYAFVRPPFELLAVFWAVGLGFSAPYLILAAFPGLFAFLPKPGPWMETLKKGLSLLLFATVAYLIWALLPFVGGRFTLLALTFAVVLTAVAAFLYGQYSHAFTGEQSSRGAFHKTKVHHGSMKIKAILLPTVCLAAAIYIGWPGNQKAHEDDAISTTPVPLFADESAAPRFTDWRPGLAERLAGEGRIVWVDFTARWCATCQVNKTVVFASPDVRHLFAEHRVIALRADWTGRDEAITAELAKWDRYAVPFNLLYAPGKKPVEMPTILTPGIVTEAIENAAK